MKTHAKICAACQVEDDDESPRFEEEIGMAWVRGFVEAASMLAGNRLPTDGFCEAHATYFKAILDESCRR